MGVLQSLSPGDYHVTIVSTDTYTLFTPLLPCQKSLCFLSDKYLTYIHLSCRSRYGISPVPRRTNSQISCPPSWPFRPSQSCRHRHFRTTPRSRIKHFQWRQSQFLYPVCIYITYIFWSLLTSPRYDKIVIAVGSSSSTHGVPGLENCLQLKTIGDAQSIRRRIMGMTLTFSRFILQLMSVSR